MLPPLPCRTISLAARWEREEASPSAKGPVTWSHEFLVRVEQRAVLGLEYGVIDEDVDSAVVRRIL